MPPCRINFVDDSLFSTSAIVQSKLNASLLIFLKLFFKKKTRYHRWGGTPGGGSRAGPPASFAVYCIWVFGFYDA